LGSSKGAGALLSVWVGMVNGRVGAGAWDMDTILRDWLLSHSL